MQFQINIMLVSKLYGSHKKISMKSSFVRMVSLLQQAENRHQQITYKKEIWGVFRELEVWPMYYICSNPSSLGSWFKIKLGNPIMDGHSIFSFLVMGSLFPWRNGIMYVLSWQTIYSLTRMSFWCLTPLLLCNLKINIRNVLTWGYKQFAMPTQTP